LITAVQHDRVKLLSEIDSIKLKPIKKNWTGKQEVEQRKAVLSPIMAWKASSVRLPLSVLRTLLNKYVSFLSQVT